MRISRDPVSGRKSEDVLRGLAYRVRKHSGDTISMYIGITSNYRERAEDHEAEYDDMILIYRTHSEKNVRTAERFLVKLFEDDLDNEIGGGGGQLGDPPYYLYLVRAH